MADIGNQRKFTKKLFSGNKRHFSGRRFLHVGRIFFDDFDLVDCRSLEFERKTIFGRRQGRRRKRRRRKGKRRR